MGPLELAALLVHIPGEWLPGEDLRNLPADPERLLIGLRHRGHSSANRLLPVGICPERLIGTDTKGERAVGVAARRPCEGENSANESQSTTDHLSRVFRPIGT